MLIIPKISRLSRSTNGSNKKRWKKDNSVQITFATFSDLSPLSLSRSRFLSPSPLSSSFPSPFQLLFIPRLLVARLPSLSVLQPVLVRQSSLTKRGREGEREREFETEASRLWGVRVNHRWKSPTLLSQWITPTEDPAVAHTAFQGVREGIIGDLRRSNHSRSRAIFFPIESTRVCVCIDR